MIKIKTYSLGMFAAFLTFCLGMTAIAQTSLQDVNQSLRYSRYSRIALKVIPVKEDDRSFKLQMVAEKLEENPEFDNYLFSYSIVANFQEGITEENIIALEETALKRDTETHYLFEETVEIPEGQEEAYVIFWAKDTRQGDEYIYHTD